MVLILVFLFTYMIFNAPIWAMALVTLPFLFSASSTIFGDHRRKLLGSKKNARQVKTVIRSQDEDLVKEVKSNLNRLKIFKLSRGKKVD